MEKQGRKIEKEGKNRKKGNSVEKEGKGGEGLGEE